MKFTYTVNCHFSVAINQNLWIEFPLNLVQILVPAFLAPDILKTSLKPPFELNYKRQIQGRSNIQ